MQKERRGFTLIELLAVIVILAIIALIAVPVIMNVIGNARKSAFEDSAYGIVKAGEMYYTNELLENGGMTSDKEFTITNGAFVGEALEVSGSLPSSGKVTVNKEGKVAVALSNGELCIQKSTLESEVKVEKQEGTCNYKTVFTKATGATSIPACITNNTTCTAGTKVGVKVNNSQTYDFYVMSEDASKGTITLIMNQNLGETVAWVNTKDYLDAGGDLPNDDECQYGGVCSTNAKGPITALKELEERTSSWTNIPLETYTLTDEENAYPTMTRTARARMITHTEATGLGCTSSSGSCPTWLYENLNSSVYWTSSASECISLNAWRVGYDGSLLDIGYVRESSNIGVRPVITISKSFL